MEAITGYDADILASMWRVEQRAVLKWMVARKIKEIDNLIEIFGGTHADSMERARTDFWVVYQFEF